ncbi:MAG: hypothetical protein KDC38_03560, partial [Planctomycetes bacterium]|nr:hypothetical protein [Planctomycetota bacterium]
DHQVYRAVGLDGSSLLVKWNSMLFGNQSIGGYAEARSPAAVVDTVTTSAPFNGFAAIYPYSVIGAFGKGWDDFQTQTPEFVTVAQNMTDATREVIVSNEIDFFEDFEATHGAGLPTETVSYGNEWDAYCIALAETSARIKRSIERLRAAEAMATVVSTLDPTFMEGREPARDLAWMDLGLFWEHDFGMVGFFSGHPWLEGRIDWQNRLADEVETYVDTLHEDARGALGSRITLGPGGDRFFVFNPLGWTRTDKVDLPYSPTTPVHVIDTVTGLEVPSQPITVGGVPTLRILARDLPPVGYRVYTVLPGAGASFGDAATTAPGSGGPTTTTYTVSADDRDATSVFATGAHHVRLSGYSVGEPAEFVSNDAEEESAAVAFTVDLPADATIVGAHLIVRAVSSQSPSPTGGMEVRLYDVADTDPFIDGAAIDLIDHHPLHPSSVIWPAPSWTPGADQTSPDLSSLVQAFIDRPDYLPGNHLGLVVTEGSLAAGRYVGWEDFASGGAPARLEVSYTSPSSPGAGSNIVVQNDRYAVTIAERGAITSLVDHDASDREFALIQAGRVINDLGGAGGTLTVESAGPVSVTVRAESSAVLDHSTRITLTREVDRIEVENELLENFGNTLTWAFGWNLAQPILRHEEVGAILDARLGSQGGHYADAHARYDLLTLNHFADMSGTDGAGVTLSNQDCYFARLGNSSTSLLDTTTPQLSVFAGGRVVNGSNGIPNQGGIDHFLQRFALRTHDGYDAGSAMRFALEHQNPPVAGAVTGALGQLPASSASFLSIDDPSVLVWTLKPADDGADQGIVARLWNVAPAPTTAQLSLGAASIAAAFAVSHIETTEGPLPVLPAGELELPFNPQQLRTVRFLIAPSGPIEFIRGDANGDGSVGDIGDPIFILGYMFASGPAPGCLESADANADGAVNLADVISLLVHLFEMGPAPPAPYPSCGTPSVGLLLGCVSPSCP